jgi:hypothetical protein
MRWSLSCGNGGCCGGDAGVGMTCRDVGVARDVVFREGVALIEGMGGWDCVPVGVSLLNGRCGR